jgi:hypothetical protein
MRVILRLLQVSVPSEQSDGVLAPIAFLFVLLWCLASFLYAGSLSLQYLYERAINKKRKRVENQGGGSWL